MGWTDKMRRNRNPNLFNSHGDYKGGALSDYSTKSTKREASDDTKNRMLIIEEIKQRSSQGEKIEDIASEIAQREHIKNQFDYYIKNGITDLGTIFANWYKGQQKSIERLRKENETR